jgi:fructose-1,6-bisphosphatase
MQSNAFIVEQAGGKAFRFGKNNQPTELHERVPFFWQLQYGRKRRVYVQSKN